MKLNLVLTASFLLYYNITFGQNNFSENPLDAIFETNDSKNFWEAFDKIDKTEQNPFNQYIQKGSLGVKGFTENRIINADSLFTVVKKGNQTMNFQDMFWISFLPKKKE